MSLEQDAGPVNEECLQHWNIRNSGAGQQEHQAVDRENGFIIVINKKVVKSGMIKGTTKLLLASTSSFEPFHLNQR